MKPTPDNLFFISAQPCDKYFVWQIEVQINNFRKFGISDKMRVLIWYPEARRKELEDWWKLSAKYEEVKFFFHKDEGTNLGLYIPQLRPHILKRHFDLFKKDLEGKIFFYHDSDIIFRELPDFDKLCEDNICWQSNTTSYLDYDYITGKEKQGNIQNNEALNKLAKIGNVTPEIIKNYNGRTGGAQYILKNINSAFWADVERMCLDIRTNFYWGIQGSFNRKYFKDENTGFQSWTADMWAVNFSLWKRGYLTDVTDELDFSWATDSIETYNKKKIFHNAGADGSNPSIFYKGAWINESPIGKNIKIPKDFASYYYVKAINEIS